MIPFASLLSFILAALVLVISPGPNMIYLISRSITQGKKAGLISLAGVIAGFLFHIILVSFGLTALLFAVPYAYTVLKTAGILYLLYLAWQAIKPGGTNVFETRKDLQIDKPGRLFTMGFFTNVLNPKVAVFYLSFFPQFIKPEYGSVFTQSVQLGITQVLVSFTVNCIIVLSAASVARWFAMNPKWGAFKYDAKKDVARIDLQVQRITEIQEAFTMFFEKNNGVVNLIMAWDDDLVRMPITF